MATGTQIDVVMPQMGVSVSEGTITKWLKQEGESVSADEGLLEISTDKVDTEVPSPGEGVVAKILVQEGETVEVGTVLAVIAPPGAEVAAGGGLPPEPATQQAADEANAAANAETPAAPAAEPVTAQQPEQPPAPAQAQPAQQPAGTNGADDGKTFVSPVVARIASEHGVDPSQVQGTGRGGRVTKKDILAFVEGGGAQQQAAQPQPQAAP
ncbi:MAG TPA: biotin/lipoyl-containing protein, partial [Gaiellaceae bacterium]|nr:biotin/lipoyl-containing protein [Gaiellaceae bacterium]